MSEIYLRTLSHKVTCKSRTESISEDARVAQDHVMNIELDGNSRRCSLLGKRRPHLTGTGQEGGFGKGRNSRPTMLMMMQ